MIRQNYCLSICIENHELPRFTKLFAINSARISETQVKRLLENSQQRQLFSVVTWLTEKVSHQKMFKTLT